MATRTIPIKTLADGSFVWEKPFAGRIHAVKVTRGTLTGGGSITITDGVSGTGVLALAAIADGVHQPSVDLTKAADGTAQAGAYGPPAVVDTLKIVVAGGGNAMAGSVKVMFN